MTTVKYKADIETPTTYTGYLVDGTMSVPLVEGNRHFREVQEWIAEDNTPEDAFTQAELDAYQLAKDNSVYEKELEDLDKASIRDIREWIASQPSAPQGLKDRESQAILARSKLK